jgi:hypothetical protein
MGRSGGSGVGGRRRRRKAVYGRTRREVVNKLTRVLRDVQQGATLPDERQTVAQFLTRWLDEKRTRLRLRAWATYEQAIRLHLVPGIGKIALARLTPAQLDTWFRERRQNGASPRAIRYARSVLRAAQNQARKWRVVSQNVAELVEAPRHHSREIQPLTPEQARTLLESAKGHRLGGIVSVANSARPATRRGPRAAMGGCRFRRGYAPREASARAERGR